MITKHLYFIVKSKKIGVSHNNTTKFYLIIADCNQLHGMRHTACSKTVETI